jgi:hypothetical protein
MNGESQNRNTLSLADRASESGVSCLGEKGVSWLAISGAIEVGERALVEDGYGRTAEEIATDCFKALLMQSHREFTKIECHAAGGVIDSQGSQLSWQFNLVAFVPERQSARDVEAFWRYCGPMETRRVRVSDKAMLEYDRKMADQLKGTKGKS